MPWQEDVANSASQLKDQVVGTVSTQKDNLEDKLESLVESASYKTEDIITTLEAKLKALKSKNRKLQQT